jgi:dTDP-4-amino-4,6-dideoxygalactose transaminase
VGDAGAFSFFPTKNLGGFGDGGLVTTRDADLAERVAKLRVHGGRQMYHHEMVGTNSRLDALQAAVLRVKLRHLDAWAAARRENACRYGELLDGVAEVRLPHVAAGCVHVYNQLTVRAERRDALREHLTGRGIGSGVYYPVPLHLQACFAGLGGKPGDLPVAEALCREVLSLPVYPELGEAGVAEVATAVRAFYG